MMRGPWAAKRYVNSYLEWDLPRRLVRYRNLWQMDDERLPTPKKYTIWESIALDEWPTVTTVQLSMNGAERIDYSDGLNPVYRCTYPMRTYVWVRAETAERVTEIRDSLATVIRAALLDRPCFIAGDQHNDHEMLLDETTLREEYSELTFVKGDRVIAGAFVGYDLSMNEVVSRDNIATLSQVDLTVEELDWTV